MRAVQDRRPKGASRESGEPPFYLKRNSNSVKCKSPAGRASARSGTLCIIDSRRQKASRLRAGKWDAEVETMRAFETNDWLLLNSMIYKIYTTEDFGAIDRLISSVRPANIGLLTDKPLTAAERDVYRAGECRKTLASVHRIPSES